MILAADRLRRCATRSGRSRPAGRRFLVPRKFDEPRPRQVIANLWPQDPFVVIPTAYRVAAVGSAGSPLADKSCGPTTTPLVLPTLTGRAISLARAPCGGNYRGFGSGADSTNARTLGWSAFIRILPPGLAATNAWLETCVRALSALPSPFDVLQLLCGLPGFCERAEFPVFCSSQWTTGR